MPSAGRLVLDLRPSLKLEDALYEREGASCLWGANGCPSTLVLTIIFTEFLIA
jgi:hypothetical protein